jgi:hypothetical protein
VDARAVRGSLFEARLLRVRRTFLLWMTASWAMVVGLLSPFTGCSSSASMSAEAGDERIEDDTFDEPPGYCDYKSFLAGGGNGSACSPIAPTKPCFLLCEASTGGCYCVAGPQGTGVWNCTTDDSCMPKCAPMDPDCGLDGSMFFDTGPIPETSIPDVLTDAPSDAGATDVTSDAPPDASKDSP